MPQSTVEKIHRNIENHLTRTTEREYKAEKINRPMAHKFNSSVDSFDETSPKINHQPLSVDRIKDVSMMSRGSVDNSTMI
jgi:hypothetical protein